MYNFFHSRISDHKWSSEVGSSCQTEYLLPMAPLYYCTNKIVINRCPMFLRVFVKYMMIQTSLNKRKIYTDRFVKLLFSNYSKIDSTASRSRLVLYTVNKGVTGSSKSFLSYVGSVSSSILWWSACKPAILAQMIRIFNTTFN